MRHLTLLALLSLPLWLSAQASGPVIGRAYSHADATHTIFAKSYTNPVVNQLRDSLSVSDVHVGYLSYKEDEPLSLQLGDGTHYLNAGASTYVKHASSTLWGSASYDNGRQTCVLWNESADAELIYPYFSADSVGGDLNLERYAFSGGYADRRGRWLWGAVLSYHAGLYYRNVDPRPRNITGLLDISAGAGYEVGGSVAAVALDFRKYKQTNNIGFVSEMGKSKVYHLTGLGNHYARFAGEGESAYFDGYRYGVSADIYPLSGRGMVVSADLSGFAFKKVLVDLNKLPLCHAWHNQMSLTAGWKSCGWGVLANFGAYRRHGIENLFGDASSGSYSGIGEIEMYADNHYHFGLEGICQIGTADATTLALSPAVAYTHRSTIYAEPASERLLNTIDTRVEMSVRSAISGKWMINAHVAAAVRTPVESCLVLPEINNRTNVVRHDFVIAEKTSGQVAVAMCMLRALSERYAIGFDLAYSHGLHTRSISTDMVSAQLRFVF